MALYNEQHDAEHYATSGASVRTASALNIMYACFLGREIRIRRIGGTELARHKRRAARKLPVTRDRLKPGFSDRSGFASYEQRY